MDLEKSLENATVIYTTGSFPVRAIFQDDCDTSNGYKLYWEVCKCEQETGSCNDIIPYGRIPGNTRKIYPRVFGAGYLYVRCLVKDANSNTITYDYGYIRITLPPLVARIEGPSAVIKGNESVVIISAAESYDPEKRHKKTEGLTLTWYCRQENMSHDNHDQFSTVSPQEAGVCQGDNTGKINNSSPLLYLDVNILKGNTKYIFDIVVQKGDRSANATHELRVEEPFVIYIR